jgi:hypothetical protein
LPFGYFVKSLTYGDTNLIEQPLRVKAPMSSEIVIVLTDKAPPSAPATFRVRGRITGAPADPITVTLTAEGPDLRMAQAIATASREFEFVKIPPGSYRLEVTVSSAQVPGRLIWPGKSTASLTVAGQDVAVDLPAFPGKEIQFEVVTPAGERLTGNYRVRIARSATDLQFVPINDGTFRAWLPNGGFTITVQRVPTSPGGRAGAPGQIQLGNPTSLKIDDATPAAPVRITVE